MKDFNVKVSVRNARLIAAIRSKFGTVAKMCRDNPSIYPSVVSAFISMKIKPYSEVDGNMSVAAMRICDALNMMPDEIWPPHIAQIKVARSFTEKEMTVQEVGAFISGPENATIQNLMLQKWIDQLSPRHRIAIECEMAEMTLESTGAELGVTRERARQIVWTANRQLRKLANRDGVRTMQDMA